MSAVTVGQITTGLNTLTKLVTALKGAVASNFTNLPDDAVVLEDGLDIASIAWPPAAAIADAIALLVAIEPLVAASGISIGPDPNPEVDSQTTTQGGR
jgi:hypothetical protein